ncbi:hypothetical protein MGYG_04034 [Nannizzia gypsea CBS 118893]|uniref:DUF4048 domain-containing protein n=1 Tax=Arthroderma gypseum (strain ATCC MYA-4604 / CBS 118893) TaxID=535722 RepID=E4UUR4_ARTGP|nr:hypothetical protein MGYG_04034 [Nannizzia gypsea CBS 118893]EFR01031.1 hypothetical protein MGYG_04034 [Nannizzia gypsea CBS 118893]
MEAQELSQDSQPCFDSPRQRQRASLPPRPNGAARHAKRLTLNFPINIPPELVQQGPLSARDSPASKHKSSESSPIMPASHRASPSVSALSEPPDEGYGFLTALAAQERKVLELKEELQRAELELATLKKQWEQNEKGRKITQTVYRAEAMKPLRQTPVEGSLVGETGATQSPADSDASGLGRVSREFDRRHGSKQSISHSPGTSQLSRARTVFEGSRHTRTLSLLSARDDYNSSPFSSQSGDSRSARPSGYPRSATLPSFDREANGSKAPVLSPAKQKSIQDKGLWRRSLPPIPQDPTTEALMRTGKQMATDFKDGLWTFIEDIRQATVGDEGINATQCRTSQVYQRQDHLIHRSGAGAVGAKAHSATPSRSGRSASIKPTTTAKPNKRGAASDTDFWEEFGVTAPNKTQPNKAINGSRNKPHNPSNQTSLLDIDDNWDIWDSPQPKRHTPSSSSSTFPSKRDQSPSTNASSPRTSASVMDYKDLDIETFSSPENPGGIPWPAIAKPTPSNLTRTASNLMAEWERSLSPSSSDGVKKGSKDD